MLSCVALQGVVCPRLLESVTDYQMQSSPIGFNTPEESQNHRWASEHLGTWLVGTGGAAPGPTNRGLNTRKRCVPENVAKAGKADHP